MEIDTLGSIAPSMQTAARVNGSARRRIGPAKNASQRQPRAGAPLCICEKGAVTDMSSGSQLAPEQFSSLRGKRGFRVSH